MKALLWRIIGIAWTWIGAYFIILLVPPTLKNAPLIATLIVVYHHSTRMVMYYFYERIWANVSWGKYDPTTHDLITLAPKDKIIWTVSVLVVIGIIFVLIVYVTPLIKK